MTKVFGKRKLKPDFHLDLLLFQPTSLRRWNWTPWPWNEASRRVTPSSNSLASHPQSLRPRPQQLRIRHSWRPSSPRCRLPTASTSGGCITRGEKRIAFLGIVLRHQLRIGFVLQEDFLKLEAHPARGWKLEGWSLDVRVHWRRCSFLLRGFGFPHFKHTLHIREGFHFVLLIILNGTQFLYETNAFDDFLIRKQSSFNH